MRLIGARCKDCEVLSLRLLIGRGLILLNNDVKFLLTLMCDCLGTNNFDREQNEVLLGSKIGYTKLKSTNEVSCDCLGINFYIIFLDSSDAKGLVI